MLKDEYGIVVYVDDWALIGGDPCAANTKILEYFLVWIGENDLPHSFIQAAHGLSDPKNATLFQGMDVSYKSEPSPGFVVQVKRNWDFESRGGAQAAVEKILWEVNHMARGLG